MGDLKKEIPQRAFINAQVIQEALRGGDLCRSLRAVEEQYKLRDYNLVNPAYIVSLLYCLILVPKEIWDPPSNDTIYRLLENDRPLDLFETKKRTQPCNEHPIRDFIRHLRNAIARVNFTVDDNGNFEFWDEPPNGHENFRTFITRDKLERFLSTVGAGLANLRSR